MKHETSMNREHIITLTEYEYEEMLKELNAQSIVELDLLRLIRLAKHDAEREAYMDGYDEGVAVADEGYWLERNGY